MKTIAIETQNEDDLNSLVQRVQAVCSMSTRRGPTVAEFQVEEQNERFFDYECSQVGVKECRTIPTLLELAKSVGPFKVLTISQPWASLIINGQKWVENRSWEPNYSGPLAIHSGKGSQYLNRKELAEYPTGCILGIVDLVASLSLSFIERQAANNDRLPWLNGRSIRDVASHEWTEGPFAWILDNVRPCVPYHIGGRLGLWTIEDIHP